MLSVAQTVAWNDRTFSEYSAERDLEGSGSALIGGAIAVLAWRAQRKSRIFSVNVAEI